jgi:hypothetical protein
MYATLPMAQLLTIPLPPGETNIIGGIMTETVTYGAGTNVLCKVCKQRKIFIDGPQEVSIEDGKRYLSLTCPSPACNQTRRYEENELEIH